MTDYQMSDLHVGQEGASLIRRIFGPSMTATQLLAELVHDLALLKALPISIDYSNEWWLVSSTKDWLKAPDGSVSLRNFRKIVHFPEAGREACHSEILLTTFAKAVVTRGLNSELMWIIGDENQWPLPEDVYRRLVQNDRGRSVAFRAD